MDFRGAGQGARSLYIAGIIVAGIARDLGLPVPELVRVHLPGGFGAEQEEAAIRDLLAWSVGANVDLLDVATLMPSASRLRFGGHPRYLPAVAPPAPGKAVDILPAAGRTRPTYVRRASMPSHTDRRPFAFTLHASEGAARSGVLHTPRGAVETPAFMPVGTLGAVKTLSPSEVRELGASMVLANTYHLYLRPGHREVRALGGLHRFMRWDGPLLTDSGGYQVFSLAHLNRISDEGAEFQSHIDGSRHFFTPESVVEIQRVLGADVIMAFDECPPGGVDEATARAANQRTLRWLERCRARFHEIEREGVRMEEGATPVPAPSQTLFPVLQGNVYPELRRGQARDVLGLGDWDGLAIGGLSVGEPKEKMLRILEVLHPELPADRPRYLMGVGYPDDLLEAVARGCDLFDCVAPTRNARHGTAWTSREGQVNLKAARFRLDQRPLDEECDCPACQGFDRAFLRHMVVAGEAFAHRLVSMHNLRFLIRLAEESRRRIAAGDFARWSGEWLERYRAARG